MFFIRRPISYALDNPELIKILPFATVSIVISSLSMTQIGLFRREFQFKKLFVIRVIGLCVPLLVTIPLAFAGFKFWSIIIGNIVLAFVNAIILTTLSSWKPSFFYNVNILKKMFSFSFWTLLEGIAMWLTSWFDTFFISTKMTRKDLGIYKTSITSTNGIINLITGSTTPVLFSGLSRLKDDDDNFWDIFFKMQRFVSILVLPLGVGMFVFRDLITKILLGNDWALIYSFKIVLGNYCSEVYRAKGKPKLSVLAEILHLLFLIPLILWAVNKDFKLLVIMRSWGMLQFVIVNFIILKIVFNVSAFRMLKNIKYIFIASVLMGIVGYIGLTINNSIFMQIFYVFVCIFVYFGLLSLFKETRKDLFAVYNLLKQSKQ